MTRPFPVNVLSYSIIRLYLHNKLAFWQKYVLEESEPVLTAPMAEGSILHEVFEALSASHTPEDGFPEVGPERMEELLTGAIEKHFPRITKQSTPELTEDHIREHASRIIPTFLTEVGAWMRKHDAEFISVEGEHQAYIKDMEGHSFPLPFVSHMDAITRHTDGERTIITIHDWKVIGSTDVKAMEKNRFAYSFQALPYFLVLKEIYPEAEIRVAYHFFKKTKSLPRKGKEPLPGYVLYEVPPFTPGEITSFCFLVELILRDMMGGQGPDSLPILLPDVFDPFTGEDNWARFQKFYNAYIL